MNNSQNLKIFDFYNSRFLKFQIFLGFKRGKLQTQVMGMHWREGLQESTDRMCHSGDAPVQAKACGLKLRALNLYDSDILEL